MYWFCTAAGDCGGGGDSDSDSDGDDSGNSGGRIVYCSMCDNKYNGYSNNNNNNNEYNNDGPNDKHKQMKLQIVEDKQIKSFQSSKIGITKNKSMYIYRR